MYLPSESHHRICIIVCTIQTDRPKRKSVYQQMLSYFSVSVTHLRAALGADDSLTEPAVVALAAEEGESGLHAEEAELAPRHILLDVTLDRQRVQLRLGEDGADVDHFVQREG